jgi:thymidine phosphorylase
LKLGRLRHDVVAERSGELLAIDNLKLAHIARLAGAPMDKGAGVDLHRKLGDHVRAGEVIYSIYAEFPADFKFSRDAAAEDPAVRID